MTSRAAIVVGAGVLGSACAYALAQRRWSVTLIDPGGLPSASAVAAGMLAPAFESLLDDADAARIKLLTHARDLWPMLAASTGVVVHDEGASWIGDDAPGVVDRLVARGFSARLTRQGAFTPDDWRLYPGRALALLARSARQQAGAVERARPGRVKTGDGWLTADHVVLAHGVGALASPEAAAVTAAVTPIRGQLLRMTGPSPPHVLRTAGAYLAPTLGGMLVGASMEPGVRSLAPDRGTTRRLLEAGERAWPTLRDASLAEAVVGVRGATPDGLPLAGPIAPGLSVALAPRRNGWLLGPLVGEIVAAYASGDDPGPFAAALDPLRFQPK